jgi:hypothetical protein
VADSGNTQDDSRNVSDKNVRNGSVVLPFGWQQRVRAAFAVESNGIRGQRITRKFQRNIYKKIYLYCCLYRRHGMAKNTWNKAKQQQEETKGMRRRKITALCYQEESLPSGNSRTCRQHTRTHTSGPLLGCRHLNLRDEPTNPQRFHSLKS